VTAVLQYSRPDKHRYRVRRVNRVVSDTGCIGPKNDRQSRFVNATEEIGTVLKRNGTLVRERNASVRPRQSQLPISGLIDYRPEIGFITKVSLNQKTKEVLRRPVELAGLPGSTPELSGSGHELHAKNWPNHGDHRRGNVKSTWPPGAEFSPANACRDSMSVGRLHRLQ
jgi:hypothetical protein